MTPEELRAIKGCGAKVTVFKGFELIAHKRALDHAPYCGPCAEALYYGCAKDYVDSMDPRE